MPPGGIMRAFQGVHLWLGQNLGWALWALFGLNVYQVFVWEPRRPRSGLEAVEVAPAAPAAVIRSMEPGPLSSTLQLFIQLNHWPVVEPVVPARGWMVLGPVGGFLFHWVLVPFLTFRLMRVLGSLLDPQTSGLRPFGPQTRIVWPTDMSAANTRTLVVYFYSRTGQPVRVQHDLEPFTAAARHQDQASRAFVSAGGEEHTLHLVFSAQKAGRYDLCLKYQDRIVRGFPVHAVIRPGRPHAPSTVLKGLASSTLVVTWAEPEAVFIQPKDQFGNAVASESLASMAGQFGMGVQERLGDPKARIQDVQFVVFHSAWTDLLNASLMFDRGMSGWYKATVSLEGATIAGGDLTVLILSPQERARVDGYVSHPLTIPTFGGSMVAKDEAVLNPAKTVYVDLTPRQLVVKEYFLRFIPLKVCSFRMVPSTRLTLIRYQDQVPVLRMGDGFQAQPDILLPDGLILMATFHFLLLRRLGGSESFAEKMSYFFDKLNSGHRARGHVHSRLSLSIQREAIVASSLRATKYFSESQWCRLFEIEFLGEQGLDHGGVRREWFEILCRELFHPKNGIFAYVEEDSEAVYPNPYYTKGAMFKFTGKIVGKCLYESAQGSAYRQHLPIRLARSFLAQILGMRVNYRHFASDAPELHASKIRYIEQNPVEDLALRFIDEVPDGDGQVITVKLKPNGANLLVNESNKLEYLDLLAQHRLVQQIKEPTRQFLSGLHQFVPDSLLTLFDESELELLLCGFREYKVSDLQAHHIVAGYAPFSSTTLRWFWAALSNFTPEQLARLLQFTTGSSRLPPGGFAELKPLFSISFNCESGNLPNAQTCSNNLVLPMHSTFKEFEQALLTAIYEGNEGFGLA